tara:strand:- start:2210 stop:4111 length:1902 start_codon:yes stop_codon:yes gene_type:complete
MANNNNKNNPKNEQSTLFKRLTKLFSGPIINYRTQTTRALKRRRLDKYARTFKDVAGQKFQRIGYNPFDNLQAQVMQTQSKLQRYADFDQMEFTPEIASALDIYADEMTTHTAIQKMLQIKCNNEEIKSILESLYKNILNLEFNLFGWCRTMCKYGDFYLYLDIDDQMGIQNVIGLPSNELERIEGEDKTNPNYIQYQWNSAGMTLENWQLAHFRILGNDKYAPYGTSVLDPARRIWRQLTLLEDAMMAYRIVRSPERRVFKVDVGNIPPEDVEQYMQKVITSMKRNQVIDQETGRVDLRYNPLSIDEDYFIPVRGGVGTTIESLPGGTYTGDIDDVKYLRDKLFSALKVPASYLSRGEGAEEDKTTLAQKDIRFARTIQRLQRAAISEIEKIGIIHLYTLGFRGDDLVSFTLSLNNPSKIAALQELEHWKTKFDTAAAATEGFFSKRWLAVNMFGISEEDFLRNQREMFFDRRIEAELEAVGEATAMGGTAVGGLEGIPGEEGMEELPELEPGAEELPSEEDTSLLAAPPPGKRDEYVTSGAKGKAYKREASDSRPIGARHRHTLSQGSTELGKMPPRQTFPGFSDLRTMSKGIYNEEVTNYDEEEEKLFDVGRDIKLLINELESKDASKAQ